MTDFEERISTLGVEALAEQVRQVSGSADERRRSWRQALSCPRCSHAVFRDNHPRGGVETFAAYLGIAGAIGVLVCTVNLLRTPGPRTRPSPCAALPPGTLPKLPQTIFNMEMKSGDNDGATKR